MEAPEPRLAVIDEAYLDSPEHQENARQMDRAFSLAAEELWFEIEDHPQDCGCVSCWEYIVLTQK
jgi:hypothetical protein